MGVLSRALADTLGVAIQRLTKGLPVPQERRPQRGDGDGARKPR